MIHIKDVLWVEQMNSYSKQNFVGSYTKEILAKTEPKKKEKNIKELVEEPLKQLGMEWLNYSLGENGVLNVDKDTEFPLESKHEQGWIINMLNCLEKYDEINEQVKIAKEKISYLQAGCEGQDFCRVDYIKNEFHFWEDEGWQRSATMSSKNLVKRFEGLWELNKEGREFFKTGTFDEYRLKLTFRDEYEIERLDFILEDFLIDQMDHSCFEKIGRVLNQEVKKAIQKTKRRARDLKLQEVLLEQENIGLYMGEIFVKQK